MHSHASVGLQACPVLLFASSSLEWEETRYNTAARVLIQNGAEDAEVPADTIMDFMQDCLGVLWELKGDATLFALGANSS